jgi:hypothetical protein
MVIEWNKGMKSRPHTLANRLSVFGTRGAVYRIQYPSHYRTRYFEGRWKTSAWLATSEYGQSRAGSLKQPPLDSAKSLPEKGVGYVF